MSRHAPDLLERLLASSSDVADTPRPDLVTLGRSPRAIGRDARVVDDRDRRPAAHIVLPIERMHRLVRVHTAPVRRLRLEHSDGATRAGLAIALELYLREDAFGRGKREILGLVARLIVACLLIELELELRIDHVEPVLRRELDVGGLENNDEPVGGERLRFALRGRYGPDAFELVELRLESGPADPRSVDQLEQRGSSDGSGRDATRE